MLVGHKQVIPIFLIAVFTGGIFYLLAQLMPGKFAEVGPFFLGGRAGLMGLAIAAITLTPNYRFYLTETFSIPLMIVTIIFVVLMLLGSGFSFPVLMLLFSGGAMGFLYVRLLRAGYRPAEWAYAASAWVEGLVTPSEKPARKYRQTATSGRYEAKQGISQRRIDEILDKINQKGYNSLSKEEKEMLLRAGRE